MKILFLVLGLLAGGLLVFCIVLAFFIGEKEHTESTQPEKGTDVRNAAFTLEGRTFMLSNGKAELQTAPGASGKETLTLFGEPAHGDFDNDGDTDAAVWLVHETGGSGAFYYVALALKAGDAYRTTNALFLGDRIAPQTIDVQEKRAVYNFAERREGEPYTAPPSVGRSVWVELDAPFTIREWLPTN